MTQAKEKLRAGELERAWGCALAAARLEVFGYSTDELAAARIALREEAKAKLGSWRQATVLEALARGESLKKVVDDVVPDKGAGARIYAILKEPVTDDTKARIVRELRAHNSDYTDGLAMLLTHIARDDMARPSLSAERRGVFSAMRIRDEHSENVHRRLALLGRQMVVLGGVLAAALVGVLVMAFLAPLDLGGTPPGGGETWIWVSLFGALGGCFTALLSVTRRSPSSRIPEQREQWLFTAARPLIGSAAALVAYSLFEAKILNLGSSPTSGALLAIAFAAGLSERLVTGAVDSVIGRDTARTQ